MTMLIIREANNFSKPLHEYILSFIKYLGSSTYRNLNAKPREGESSAILRFYVHDYRISYTNISDNYRENHKQQLFAMCRFPKTITENSVNEFLD